MTEHMHAHSNTLIDFRIDFPMLKLNRPQRKRQHLQNHSEE